MPLPLLQKSVDAAPVAVESPQQIAPQSASSEIISNGSSDKSFFSKNTLAELQLFLEDLTLRAYWRLSILQINSHRLFHDIGIALKQIAFLSGFSSFITMLGHLLAVLVLAGLLELLFRRIILRRYLNKPSACPLTWSHHISMALKQAVPEIVSLLFFGTASYVLYILVYSPYFSIICPFYLSVMVAITAVRLFMTISAMIIAPTHEPIRFMSWDDKTSRVVHRSGVLFITILAIGVVTTSLLKYGGLKGDSLLLVKLFFGTLLIVSTGIVIFLNTQTIANLFARNSGTSSQYQKSTHTASYSWLSILGFYLFVIWLIWSFRLILFETKFTMAFSVSLLIIPIFLILDGLMEWFFQVVRQEISGKDEHPNLASEVSPQQGGTELITTYVRGVSRLLLAALLFMWILHLWGINFAFSSAVVAGMRKVLTVFIIFFFIWQLVDKSISSFLRQKHEVVEENDESGESEWGDGPMLDRSQTLLPIVRKFLGIVMLVLLVLFTLSSLGVNIGPLLAGAGVMGIAIGFGAQKLVSDLLSGFFYLVDDAFRVGEYIEAGSTTGTVEKITLRNLMLRHHRGMLQIVPYSDLGAITNYMRGGIVVKFNLQFPYDTDVDLVRKVVKRVGLEMIDDPELGHNFLKQLKSQGIREVGDSVLTIRVKFTANPGTHFVIRREAYRRITEALNAKGIFYAHRKVIVDLPEETQQKLSGETQRTILEAGAAAELASTNNNQEQGSHTKT